MSHPSPPDPAPESRIVNLQRRVAVLEVYVGDLRRSAHLMLHSLTVLANPGRQDICDACGKPWHDPGTIGT
jgi:hypothetical protein